MSDYIKLFESLKIIKEVLNSLNIKWCLTFGSLLGAVREQDFIQNGHEDIDIFLINISVENFNKAITIFLKKKQFRGIHVRSNPSTFFNGNSGFDLGRIGISPKKNDGCYYYKHFPFPARFFEPLEVSKIKNIECPVPNHAEELLEAMYGKDWRIPKKMRVPFSSLAKQLRNIQ